MRMPEPKVVKKPEESILTRPYLKEGGDLGGLSVCRKPLDHPLNPMIDQVEFMQIEVDQYITNSTKLPDYIPARPGEDYAVIRIFGVTMEGHSVMAHLHGF